MKETPLFSPRRGIEEMVRYLYLEPFLPGKDVLVVTAGPGKEAVAPLESLGVRSTAHAKPPAPAALPADMTSLRGRTDAVGSREGLRFRDAAFDVAFVPEIADLPDPGFLCQELDRVLTRSGTVLVATRNASCLSPICVPPEGGHAEVWTYSRLLALLKAFFPFVRMVGQGPFLGYTFVEYQPRDSADVRLDTTLMQGRGEDPEFFVAVCSRDTRLELPLPALFQVPLQEFTVAEASPSAGPASTESNALQALAAEEQLADSKRELEAARAELAERNVKVARLEQELKKAEADAAEARDRSTRLTKALEEERRADQRKAIEATFARVAQRTDIVAGPPPARPADEEDVQLLKQQADARGRLLEEARRNAEEARDVSEKARTRVAELQKNLEEEQRRVRQAQAAADQARVEARETSQRAQREAQEAKAALEAVAERAHVADEARRAAEEKAQQLEERLRRAEEAPPVAAVPTPPAPPAAAPADLEASRREAEARAQAAVARSMRLETSLREAEDRARAALAEKERLTPACLEAEGRAQSAAEACRVALAAQREAENAALRQVDALETRLRTQGRHVAEIERRLADRDELLRDLMRELSSRPLDRAGSPIPDLALADDVVAVPAEAAPTEAAAVAVGEAAALRSVVARLEGELTGARWRNAELETAIQEMLEDGQSLETERERLQNALEIAQLAAEEMSRTLAARDREAAVARQELETLRPAAAASAEVGRLVSELRARAEELSATLQARESELASLRGAASAPNVEAPRDRLRDLRAGLETLLDMVVLLATDPRAEPIVASLATLRAGLENALHLASGD